MAEPEGTGKLWAYINSPIFLFLLSSVFLSGITFFYQNYKDYLEKSRNFDNSAKKILSEIKYRIDILRSVENRKFSFTKAFTIQGAAVGRIENIDSSGSRQGLFSPLHPDFSERSLGSLIYEYSQYCPKIGNRNLQGLLNISEEIVDISENGVHIVDPVRPGFGDSMWELNDDRKEAFRRDLSEIEKSFCN